MIDLDDVHQGVFSIPFVEEESAIDSASEELFKLPTSDLPDGHIRRWKSYSLAWAQCLARIREIVSKLYQPVIDEVMQFSETCHLERIPLLEPELPIICLYDASSNSSFVSQVIECFQSDESGNEICHLHPEDCQTMVSAMRALITGLLADETLLSSKNISLANYDIELLEAWYKSKKSSPTAPSKLIVAFHDFEQMPINIIEDLFYICSMHVETLPFLFVLLMDSAPSPSYIHASYSRESLSCLRIKRTVTPSSLTVIETVLTHTFFAVDWRPNIVIGPSIIEFIKDYSLRQNSSLDQILTILQLCHLKHFTNNHLSSLVDDTPALSLLTQKESFPFLDALFARIHAPLTNVPLESNLSDWQEASVPSLIETVDAARESFYRHAKGQRLGFQLFELCRQFILKAGNDIPARVQSDLRSPPFRLMILILEGRLESDITRLCGLLGKLDIPRFEQLLEELQLFCLALPSEVQEDESGSLEAIDELKNSIPDPLCSVQEKVKFGARLREWLSQYLMELVSSLDESNLWDIWYTRYAPVPSDLFDPSFRLVLMTGLAHPEEYAEHDSQSISEEPTLTQLPDTSILFKRYSDSSKMLNIYDFFESFQTILESQSRQTIQKPTPKSPSKRSPRKKKRAQSEDGDEPDQEAKDRGHARFLKAFQELDYLGFVKHSGRKADHIQRTVYDILD